MQFSAEDFHYIQDLVRQQTAIALDDRKCYLVEARLGPLARQEGLESPAELVTRLRDEQSAQLQKKIIEAITAQETCFFRDVSPFDVLRKEILPHLILRRQEDRELRIWSAGCSTGQEPFSLALILREYFKQLSDWEVSILATDVCPETIDRARSGRYSQLEINRGVPATLLIKHFQKAGMEWQLKPEVLDLVEFRTHDLRGPWPELHRMDLILCRNVLMQFDARTKERVLERMTKQLVYDGILMMGSAESLLGANCPLECVPLEKTRYYRIPRPPWDR
jgi:chemotaxis protein methyltransferase CheR